MTLGISTSRSQVRTVDPSLTGCQRMALQWVWSSLGLYLASSLNSSSAFKSTRWFNNVLFDCLEPVFVVTFRLRIVPSRFSPISFGNAAISFFSSNKYGNNFKTVTKLAFKCQTLLISIWLSENRDREIVSLSLITKLTFEWNNKMMIVMRMLLRGHSINMWHFGEFVTVSPNVTRWRNGANKNVKSHFLFTFVLNFTTKSLEKAMYLSTNVTWRREGVWNQSKKSVTYYLNGANRKQVRQKSQKNVL